MNLSLGAPGGDGLVLRSKRGAKEFACSGIEYGSVYYETVADVSGDINSIPGLGVEVGIATAASAGIAHIMKGGMSMLNTALGCDDIPFDEIKNIMKNRFNTIDRNLDAQVEAMEKVSKMVSKTLHNVEKINIEMKSGFNKVINAIENNAIKEKTTQIYNFVDYFTSEKKRIQKLPKDEYVAKLSEDRGILRYLKESRTPKDDSLHTAMYAIIHNKFAIPNDANDKKAFQALYALFFGTQTYAAVFGFLMESHSFLANYYYQTGNYENFNKQIAVIKTVFNDFRHSLVGDNYGFVVRVGDVIEQIKSKNFTKNVNNPIYKQVADRERILNSIKTEIKSMILPIIQDNPPKPTLQFKEGHSTPVGKWKAGVTVKYAVQYEKNGIYSKISDWSDSLTIRNKISPYVKTRHDPEGRNKLVFRKLGNDTPQLIGILGKSKTELKDKDRDLYDAAGKIDFDSGLEEARTFINKGANINAIFELGQTSLHNVARSGNVELLKLLMSNGTSAINVQDKLGRTPLHVCAENDRSEIIPELVKYGADVNAATNGDKYTPLHIATRNGYLETADALLKSKDINVNAQDKNGFTEMHYLVAGPTFLFRAVVFRTQDVDVNAKSRVGLTTAHLAAMKDDQEKINILKESNKCNMNTPDMNNMTPLHYAAMLGNIETVKKILTVRGIDVNVHANNKWTALHYAIYFKKDKVAIELIKNPNTYINAFDGERNRPLHFAAATGQENIVQELLLHDNAGLEDTNFMGYRPLHLAVANDSMGCVVALINKGADVNSKIRGSISMLDLAMKYASEDLQNYIKSEIHKRIGQERADVTFTANDAHKSNIVSPLINEQFRYGIAATSKSNSSMLLGSGHSFNRIKRPIQSNIDTNGALLLLDVLLRKLTNEKYDLTVDGAVQELEATVKALSITEMFEEFINSLNTKKVEEEIDLSEVFSRVKKALVSGRSGHHVTEVLCSYAEKLYSLYLDNKKYFLEDLRSANPLFENSDEQLSENIKHLLKETCAF